METNISVFLLLRFLSLSILTEKGKKNFKLEKHFFYQGKGS